MTYDEVDRLFRHQRSWWYPLIRPRHNGEPRYRWIGNLAWAWMRFMFWGIAFIACIPLFIIEKLDDAHEDYLCAQWEQEELRREMERELRRQPLSD